MRRSSRHERGSALLTAMAVTLVLLTVVAGILTYARLERGRATSQSRALNRVGCAQAGLQIARSYFTAKHDQWGNYLQHPEIYDPVPATWNVGQVADPVTSTTPDLKYDLDGDSLPDVFIYIRDNQDELPPAANNWKHDNDQNVFVGAVCISTTLVPRLQNGQPDPAQLTAEALLSYNTPGNNYGSQANGGASGNGNIN